jgi:hypothetical protein
VTSRILMYLSLLALLFTPSSIASPSSDLFELRVGQQAVRGTSFVIELGLIRSDKPFEMSVSVRNATNQSVALTLAPTSSVTATWVGQKPEERSSIRTLTPNRPESISIRLSPAVPDPVPLVRLLKGGANAGSIAFSFLAKDYLLSRTSGGLHSVVGGTNISVCTGHAPTGYKLLCDSIRFHGAPIQSKPWDCGSNQKKSVAGEGKSLVCKVFSNDCGISPSGPDPNNTCVLATPGGSGFIDFYADLTYQFVMLDQSPKLRLLADVVAENKKRDSDANCEADWEKFLAANKTIPQFQLWTYQGTINGFRSKACDPVQMSDIGLGAEAVDGWVDMKYAGVRLKTSGRTVAIGIIPAASPTFAAPNPMDFIKPSYIYTSVEVMIIRDLNTVVGSFLLGSETSRKPLIFGITFGASLIAFDTPPAGTHLYTLKAKFKDKSAQTSHFLCTSCQIFATELSNKP